MSNVLPSEAMLPQWLLGRLAKLMDCEVQLSVAACAGCATPIATLAMGGQAGDPEESQSLAEALQRIQ